MDLQSVLVPGSPAFFVGLLFCAPTFFLLLLSVFGSKEPPPGPSPADQERLDFLRNETIRLKHEVERLQEALEEAKRTSDFKETLRLKNEADRLQAELEEAQRKAKLNGESLVKRDMLIKDLREKNDDLRTQSKAATSFMNDNIDTLTKMLEEKNQEIEKLNIQLCESTPAGYLLNRIALMDETIDYYYSRTETVYKKTFRDLSWGEIFKLPKKKWFDPPPDALDSIRFPILNPHTVYFAPAFGERFHSVSWCYALDSALNVDACSLEEAQNKKLQPCPFCVSQEYLLS